MSGMWVRNDEFRLKLHNELDRGIVSFENFWVQICQPITEISVSCSGFIIDLNLLDPQFAHTSFINTLHKQQAINF